MSEASMVSLKMDETSSPMPIQANARMLYKKKNFKVASGCPIPNTGRITPATKMKLIQATLRCAKVLPAITAKDDPLANEINSRSVFVFSS
ncbi:hypothetical protein D3C78_1272410 [compost metagenome]